MPTLFAISPAPGHSAQRLESCSCADIARDTGQGWKALAVAAIIAARHDAVYGRPGSLFTDPDDAYVWLRLVGRRWMDLATNPTPAEREALLDLPDYHRLRASRSAGVDKTPPGCVQYEARRGA